MARKIWCWDAKILLDLFAYKAAFKLERNHIILHYIHKYPQHGLKLAQRFNVDNFDTIFNYVLHHQPEVIFKDLNSRNSILKRWYKNNKLPAFQLLLSLTKYHKSQYYFLSIKIYLKNASASVTFTIRSIFLHYISAYSAKLGSCI